MTTIVKWKSEYIVAFQQSDYEHVSEWLFKEYRGRLFNKNHIRMTIRFNDPNDAVAFKLKHG